MLRFNVIATFAEAAWRIAPACYARSFVILRSALSSGARANISDSRSHRTFEEQEPEVSTHMWHAAIPWERVTTVASLMSL